MTEKKKMYVVFCEDTEKYWCSYNTWSDQLRKATIFHSIKYANEVHKRFKELRLKNVEVRMEVVPEKPTNADRIRSMSDESVAAVLKTLCTAIIDCMGCPLYRFGCPGNNDLNDWIKWIQQPAEENKNGV